MSCMMLRIITLYVMSLLLQMPDDTACYEVMNGTLKTYKNSCSSNHQNISNLHEELITIMKKKNLVKLLFPVVRHDFDGWFWISGDYYGTTLNRKTQNSDKSFGRDCGVLRTMDKLLDDVQCYKSYRKFLCQEKGALCKEWDKDCFLHNNTAYSIIHEPGNWYNAKMRCEQMKKDLASVSKENMGPVLEFLKHRVTTYTDLWLGIRKSDYVTVEEGTDVSTYFWDPDDICPCASPHTCVILTKTEGNVYVWRPADCTTQVPFVCFVINEGTSLYQNVTEETFVTPNQPPRDGQSSLFGMVIALVVMMVLVLLVSCCIVVGQLCIMVSLSENRSTRGTSAEMRTLRSSND